MGVNFKEACTYVFKDNGWKSKFAILTILFFVSTTITYLTQESIFALIIGLFSVGYNILLTNNLINDAERVLPDFKIKELFQKGIKYLGVVFTILAIYAAIGITVSLLSVIISIITIVFAKLYPAFDMSLFNPLLFVSPLIVIGIIVFLGLFIVFILPFSQLLFSENFSYKESFNIKKMFKVFGANWGLYILLFVLTIFMSISIDSPLSLSFIYDNKPILVLFALLVSIVNTFIYFMETHLITNAYKLSLAKIESDDSKLEQLNHKFNSFDYKAIGAIVVISITLFSTMFMFPVSRNSSLGKLIYFDSTKFTTYTPSLYDLHHVMSCNPRYELKNPTLFPIIQDRKMGYIDKNGKIVITPKYTYADDFYEGLARVRVGGRKPSSLHENDMTKGGKYGFIDTKGDFVIKPIYDYAANFGNGKAEVRMSGLKPLYIDKRGKYIKVNRNLNNQNFGNNVLTYKNKRYTKVNNVPNTYINGTSKIHIDKFYQGLARIEQNNKTGLIDKTGKTIIPIKYDYISEFREGLAVVVLNKKYGFINQQGEIVIQPQFKDACTFSEGYADVNINDKVGYIDKKGNIAIPTQYDGNYAFINGVAPVQVAHKWGYIDKTGKYIWKPTK